MTNVIRKKQLSQETRNKIVEKYNLGKSTKIIAEELEVNYKTVMSVITLFKRTGRIQAIEKRRAKVQKINTEEKNFILSLIDNDVSIPLKKMKEELRREKNKIVSLMTIKRAIKEFNYTFKRVQLIPSARNTESNITTRFNYANEYLILNEDKVIFADEMGVNCSIRCSYGRSLSGTTPRKIVRTIRSKNLSISAAISKKEILYYKPIFESYNGERFCAFIRELLLVLEQKGMVNSIIIMYNCSIHKIAGVREAITSGGHRLVFLPPYSPQLNPIEELFSKWKYSIKTMNPNTHQQLEDAINVAHNSITEEDCEGYFSHMREFALKAIRREYF